MIDRDADDSNLGLNLRPGDEHYRAYVGPPKDYDLVSAMVFNLLTCIGLRQHHRVLDIGCGSLRVGRLLIPYLNKYNYYGVEPNKWLVKDGIENEIGLDLINIKSPSIIYSDSLSCDEKPLEIDFAFAQSIFSHCGADLINKWLKEVSYHLKSDGALLATYLDDTEDFQGSGWVYPECVKFTDNTMAKLAIDNGLNFTRIDWGHPRQTWAVFSKEEFDPSLINHGKPPSWNRFIEKQNI